MTNNNLIKLKKILDKVNTIRTLHTSDLKIRLDNDHEGANTRLMVEVFKSRLTKADGVEHNEAVTIEITIDGERLTFTLDELLNS